MDIIEKMKKEMFRRKLSHKTIMTYMFYVKKFLLFCKKSPKKFSKKDCKEFLEKFMDKEFEWMKKRPINDEIAGSTLNVALNSLRFMMEEVLRKSMRLNIRYSKTPKALPIYLTKDEVKRLINSISNYKHRILTSLMYGAGLRVSEVVNLKHIDIGLEEGIGWVRKGKGNKDRPFIIPQCLKEDIKNVIRVNKRKSIYYVFPGRKGMHLSTRSVQMILKKASKISGINKNIHPHTLRHSFATHILEAGADVTVVQSLLGHNESRTTMGYIHTIKPKLISVRSPLDDI
ncbi:MAG: tyrosine-type recombinase/integrase [Nanoarchaeota archaeon]|nr:tyrosine-type recombinase/integrase [Nanoarchaeota archaeon]